MAVLTVAADIGTYIGEWRGGFVSKRVTGTGTDDSAVGAAPGTGYRIILLAIIADCDTAGISVDIRSGATVMWTLRFPVADSVVIPNIRLECTANEALIFNKSDAVSDFTAQVVYKVIASGENLNDQRRQVVA